MTYNRCNLCYLPRLVAMKVASSVWPSMMRQRLNTLRPSRQRILDCGLDDNIWMWLNTEKHRATWTVTPSDRKQKHPCNEKEYNTNSRKMMSDIIDSVVCRLIIGHSQWLIACTSHTWFSYQLSVRAFEWYQTSQHHSDHNIHIDSDISMGSHVTKTVSSYFTVLRQIHSIKRAISRLVLQSLAVSMV